MYVCKDGAASNRSAGAAVEIKNITQVAGMFTNAADQGHIRAQYNLGMIFQNGSGVAQDYIRSMQWFRKAADQGLAIAQSKLGNMYQNGDGAAADYNEAAQWYHKAADQGLAEAQFRLGGMYYWGIGVAQDLKEALFFISAAEAQDAEGCVKLRKLIEADLRLTSSECYRIDALSPSKCMCCGRDADNTVKLKPCPRCKGPLYCGKECQSKHWENGHRECCTKK